MSQANQEGEKTDGRHRKLLRCPGAQRGGGGGEPRDPPPKLIILLAIEELFGPSGPKS